MNEAQPSPEELLALEPLPPTHVAERGTWQVIADYWVSIERLQEALVVERRRSAELDSWEATFGPTEEPG